MFGNPIFCCNRRIAAAKPNGSHSAYQPIRLLLRRGFSLAILRFRYERGFPNMLWSLTLGRSLNIRKIAQEFGRVNRRIHLLVDLGDLSVGID